MANPLQAQTARTGSTPTCAPTSNHATQATSASTHPAATTHDDTNADADYPKATSTHTGTRPPLLPTAHRGHHLHRATHGYHRPHQQASPEWPTPAAHTKHHITSLTHRPPAIHAEKPTSTPGHNARHPNAIQDATGAHTAGIKICPPMPAWPQTAIHAEHHATSNAPAVITNRPLYNNGKRTTPKQPTPRAHQHAHRHPTTRPRHPARRPIPPPLHTTPPTRSLPESQNHSYRRHTTTAADRRLPAALTGASVTKSHWMSGSRLAHREPKAQRPPNHHPPRYRRPRPRGHNRHTAPGCSRQHRQRQAPTPTPSAANTDCHPNPHTPCRTAPRQRATNHRHPAKKQKKKNRGGGAKAEGRTRERNAKGTVGRNTRNTKAQKDERCSASSAHTRAPPPCPYPTPSQDPPSPRPPTTQRDNGPQRRATEESAPRTAASTTGSTATGHAAAAPRTPHRDQAKHNCTPMDAARHRNLPQPANQGLQRDTPGRHQGQTHPKWGPGTHHQLITCRGPTPSPSPSPPPPDHGEDMPQQQTASLQPRAPHRGRTTPLTPRHTASWTPKTLRPAPNLQAALPAPLDQLTGGLTHTGTTQPSLSRDDGPIPRASLRGIPSPAPQRCHMARRPENTGGKTRRPSSQERAATHPTRPRHVAPPHPMGKRTHDAAIPHHATSPAPAHAHLTGKYPRK